MQCRNIVSVAGPSVILFFVGTAITVFAYLRPRTSDLIWNDIRNPVLVSLTLAGLATALFASLVLAIVGLALRVCNHQTRLRLFVAIVTFVVFVVIAPSLAYLYTQPAHVLPKFLPAYVADNAVIDRFYGSASPFVEQSIIVLTLSPDIGSRWAQSLRTDGKLIIDADTFGVAKRELRYSAPEVQLDIYAEWHDLSEPFVTYYVLMSFDRTKVCIFYDKG